MYSTQVIVLHTTGQTKKMTSSVFCFAFVCHDTHDSMLIISLSERERKVSNRRLEGRKRHSTQSKLIQLKLGGVFDI